MPRALFASDLHLCASRPAQAARFFELLARAPGRVDAVYLLGDLVEFWPGDDDDDVLHRQLVQALRSLTLAGVDLAVMTGNRDFLMQSRFAGETGAELLPDYHRVELAGVATLLTHGDLLCTRDVQYLQFRETVRAPARQAQFLGLPLEERRRIANATRAGTQQSMSAKDDYIMDAEETEVMRVMRQQGVRRLIHGHTHRPAIHQFDLDGAPGERVVLGDWYEGDLVYLCEPSANRLVSAETLLSLWS
ncbi:MAG: UDP-2,3-diacylglucosamine diphosphatase [Gammaproteobacteria bacterium]|nr:UDP-2,3-diacylglucosamine diphosphatase [Gammaproteobacteria bacterium]